MAPPPLVGRDEGRRFYLVLPGLLITVYFTLLVDLPSRPESSQLLFSLYVASLILMFFAGFILQVLGLDPEGATDMISEELFAWLQSRATWAACGSLLQVFVLQFLLQLPRSTLIPSALLFGAMLLSYGVLPLLPKWIEHLARLVFSLSRVLQDRGNLMGTSRQMTGA